MGVIGRKRHDILHCRFMWRSRHRGERTGHGGRRGLARPTGHEDGGSGRSGHEGTDLPVVGERRPRVGLGAVAREEEGSRSLLLEPGRHLRDDRVGGDERDGQLVRRGQVERRGKEPDEPCRQYQADHDRGDRPTA